MREIKFRAWDGISMRYGGFSIHATGKTENTSLNPPLLNISQYTGLKDRNGKEIYEGDIYISNSSRKDLYQIFFGHGSFLAGKTIEYAEPLGWGVSGCEGGEMVREKCWWLEVIGNIYANPDLVKQEVA